MIGRIIAGRYEVASLLGVGGMAQVYRAKDLNLGREVALKVLLESVAEDPEFRERFRREARASAVLAHPNIVQVYDFFESDEGVFIVMELVEGSDLRQIMRSGSKKLGIEESVRIASDVLAALECAHSKGIVHRDISSRNVMLTSDGKVKVADFGIAMIVGERTLTQTGELIGSVQYISPEQAGGGNATPKTDIYSVGVLLYEMLTGRLPFNSDNVVKLALMHVQNEVPLPSSYEGSVPKFLDDAVVKAMAKNPDDRFVSASEMARALQGGQNLYSKVMHEGASSRPLSDKRVSLSLNGAAAAAGGSGRSFADNFETTERTVLRTDISKKLMQMNADERESSDIYSFTGESSVDVVDIQADSLEENQEYFEEDYIPEDEFGDESLENSENYENYEEYDENGGDELPPESSLPNKGIKAAIIAAAAVLITLAAGITWYCLSGDKEVPVPNLIGQRLEAARDAAESLGFKVERRQDKYDDSAAPNLVLAQDPEGGKAVPEGSVIFVDVSVGREHVVLPDLTGMTEEHACRELDGLGLSFTVVMKENSHIAAGTVFEQEPAFGSEAAVGSEVTLFVSQGDAGIPVPDFVGMNVKEAEKTAKSLGFKIELKKSSDKGRRAGEVAAQEPSAASKAKRGASLCLYVCEAEQITAKAVPDLVGKTAAEALKACEQLGINLFIEGDKDSDAVIVSQKTSPGEVIADSKLYVRASADKFVPNVCGMSYDEAVSVLKQAGFKVGSVSSVSGSQSGIVLEQVPGAGEASSKGTSVNLAVSQAQEPVQSIPQAVPTKEAVVPEPERAEPVPSVQKSIPMPTPSSVKIPQDKKEDESDLDLPGDLP